MAWKEFLSLEGVNVSVMHHPSAILKGTPRTLDNVFVTVIHQPIRREKLAIVASPYTMTNHLEEVIVMTRTPVSSASVIIMPTVVFIIKLWTPALTHVPRGEEVCV
ncbi:uncharacterized protein LOC113665749 [Pocillopora damicornis]|uniref:uncharacterized protein LOC113665749 n=1 Tax=Pocillopora damicornis TaxID=46731 RepID=UPI000F54F3DB|nr:uncharacterized protein LOC113665749 [Pocillopora damicornis]